MQRNVLYCMYTCTPFIPIVVSFIFQTLLSLFFKPHNLKPPIDIGELTRPRCDVTKIIWMVSKGTILAPKMAEDFKLVKIIHPDIYLPIISIPNLQLKWYKVVPRCCVWFINPMKYSDISTNSTIVDLVINQLSYY